jgi:DNA-binding transcriptional ArsR family regulator
MEEGMAELEQSLRDFLQGLASETRQHILLTAFADGQERTVGEIAVLVGLGQSTTSEHLSVLKRAGILLSRREGKEVYYAANRQEALARLSSLNQFLQQCCAEE